MSAPREEDLDPVYQELNRAIRSKEKALREVASVRKAAYEETNALKEQIRQLSANPMKLRIEYLENKLHQMRRHYQKNPNALPFSTLEEQIDDLGEKLMKANVALRIRRGY